MRCVAFTVSTSPHSVLHPRVLFFLSGIPAEREAEAGQEAAPRSGDGRPQPEGRQERAGRTAECRRLRCAADGAADAASSQADGPPFAGSGHPGRRVRADGQVSKPAVGESLS